MIKICLHSVPRSGSTWLGSIIDSSPNVSYRFQPLFSYKFKSRLNPKSNYKEIELFFENIFNTNDEFVLQKDAHDKGLIPKFIKDQITHICYKEVRYHHILENLLRESKKLIVIGLVRNPFAVMNSWINAPKEFKKELGWSIQNEWKDAPKKNMNKPEEFNGYNKWKQVCFLFLRLKKEYPDQFYLINYDDLLSNPISEVKQLFEFSKLEYSEQTNAYIKESTSFQSTDAYSVFKQKKNDMGWKKTLPSFIEHEIKEDEDFNTLNTIFKWIY